MYYSIKNILTVGLTLTALLSGFGQPMQGYKTLLSKLEVGSAVPADLLAGRSVVLYTPQYDYDKLKKVQQTFQQTGIDVVCHFNIDMVFANVDALREASLYFRRRAISFLIMLHKEDSLFSLSFTRFNGSPSMVDAQQPAWRVAGFDLDKVLTTVYRTAIVSQPGKNLLINEFPETDFVLDIVKGKSLAFFAIDLKADKLAVPWFGRALADSTLVHFFERNYPFQFGMTYEGEETLALRNRGFLYVLKYVCAREATAKKLLGYSDKKANTTPARPRGTQVFDGEVYKFYVQHLVSGDVFLGTQWDVRSGWEESLKAYFDRLKKEFGL